MTMRSSPLCTAVLLSLTSCLCHADFIVTKTGDTLVDAKALTIEGDFGQCINGLSFQQDALVSHEGYQYVTFYDADRHVCLSRRKLPEGAWTTIRFLDYDFKSNDAHNTISLGICPKDGTIHLAFDHHGHPLHYRVSEKNVATNPKDVAWDAALFGPVTSELEQGKSIRITYPRFWQTPDGGLQFCYRRGGSGNGDRMLADYDVESGTWINTRQIDSGQSPFEDAMGKSDSRCSYPNGYTYGPLDRLHTTWVWRESSQGANHDLIYAYSADRGKTWRNNAGEALAEPPHVGSPGLRVVDIGREYGLMNTHGQAVDSQGRIHAVIWHCTDQSLKAANSSPGQERWGPPTARSYHHYWRDHDTAWHHAELPGGAGTRPKLFMDADDNAYQIASNAWARGLFGREGALIIMAASSESDWTDWKVIHTEQGPFLNEMLADYYRWKKDGVLSIMVQESPDDAYQPTPLRVLDFVVEGR